MKGHVSRRPRLPVPFVVGVFSAIALGLAWGLVYFNMPTPVPPIAVTSPAPAGPFPPPLTNDTPAADPSSASPTIRSPADSNSTPSPPPNVLSASPPPAETAVTPAFPVPKGPKAGPSPPPASSSAPALGSPLPTPSAPDSPALQAVSPACIVELEKLCEGTEPGEARRKCFKDKETKLSPVCQRQMDEMASRIKEDMQHFRAACAGDVTQFCPEVQPGGGNVLQCLEDNYKEVSENCYQALKHFQKRKAGRSL